MTTLYVNANSGSDSAPNDGSLPLPYRTWEKARSMLSDGNHNILLAAGQRHTPTALFMALRGSSNVARFRVARYGDGVNPVIAPGWAPGASTSLQSVYATVNNWIYEDLTFDAENVANMSYAGGMVINSAANISNGTFLRCEFRNAIVGFFPGHTGGTSYGAYTMTNILVDSCVAHSNQRHGFYQGSGDGVIYSNCTAYNNGFGDGGHGFSSEGAGRVTFTTGWSNTPATTIYYRALTLEAWGVFTDDVQAYYALSKKTSGDLTDPGLGEYSWTAGTLYINIGSNPDTKTVVVCQIKNTMIWQDCEAYDTKAYAPYTYVEGAGFQFDGYTSLSTMIRCKSHDNSGAGFAFNQTAQCSVIDSVAYGNGLVGFGLGKSRGSIWQGNTSYRNALGGMRYPTGAAITAPAYELSMAVAPSCTLNNIAIVTGAAGAIECDPTSVTGSTATHIMVDGTPAAVWSNSTITGASQSVTQMGLRSFGKPRASSAVLGAGTDVGSTTDVLGNARAAPPAIGAYDASSLSAGGGGLRLRFPIR